MECFQCPFYDSCVNPKKTHIPKPEPVESVLARVVNGIEFDSLLSTPQTSTKQVQNPDSDIPECYTPSIRPHIPDD